jgi:ABC-type transport system substrate-binding protein
VRRVLPLLTLLILSCSRRDGGDAERAPAGVLGARAPMLVVAVAEEPDQLAPPFARSSASAAIWPWILPALVRAEAESLGAGRFVGDLATSWEMEDGGRATRFYLGGRMWEDTTAVGAQDVVTSYRLYRDPAVGGDWPSRLTEIASVEAPAGAAGIVLFKFRRPLSEQRALQLAALPLIEADQYEKTKGRRPLLGEPGRPVHAAGPFRVEEWKQGESIRLARHPFPPEGRAPRADRILIRFVPAGRSRALQLEQGIADVAIDLPVGEARRLREEGNTEIRLVRAGAIAVEALAFNLDHPVWGRWDLRRMARTRLDARALARAAAGGGEGGEAWPCSGFLGLAPDSAAAPVPADSAQAPFALLGAPSIEILYDTADARSERIAVDAALQLDRLGVDCRLRPLPARECLTRIAGRLFDATVVSWTIPATGEIGEIWRTGGSANVAGLSDTRVDSLVAWARSPAADTVSGVWEKVDRRARSLDACVFVDRRARIDGVGAGVTGHRADPLHAYGDLLPLEWRPPAEGSGAKKPAATRSRQGS